MLSCLNAEVGDTAHLLLPQQSRQRVPQKEQELACGLPEQMKMANQIMEGVRGFRADSYNMGSINKTRQEKKKKKDLCSKKFHKVDINTAVVPTE